MTEEEFQDLCDAAFEVFLTPEKGADQVMLVVAVVSRFLYAQYLARHRHQPDITSDDVIGAFASLLKKGFAVIAEAKA